MGLKGPFTQAIFVAQFNEIFVALKLQLQNGACKPAAISVPFYSVIHRRGLRCNSVPLSSSFTFEQAHSFCLRNRCALTFCTDKLHAKGDEIAASCEFSATKITCVNRY